MDLYGFRLEGEEKVPSYDGRASLYVHEKTGFKVIAIENRDIEQFFSYVVYTPCGNSSGVFHIIEHTVLSGSRKYPVKDAFTTQMSRGCPTFMNAMTGADRTYYLAASTVKKDFENIFKVYTDAVFEPLLRKETFLQEGIRISYDGGPHFDGVVFSEMQGATSQHESVLSSLSSHGLFPGCQYENESGGLPSEIARLSYEEYLETYKKYYVPSNMCLLLYGGIDKNGIMRYLDEEYLSSREYVSPPGKVVLPPRWKEPRSAYATSSSSDEGANGKASLLYSWRLDDSMDGVEGATLTVLTDMLLGSAGCPLYSAITSCPYAEDISTESGMIWDYSEYAFSVGMAGVERADYEKAAEYLLSAIRNIAKKGFSPREKEAALRRNEFNLREISGGNPQGMKALFRIDKPFAYGGDILSCLYPERDMAEVRRRSEENPRYFEQYIERNFIDNPHRLLSIVAMDDGKDEEVRLQMDAILSEEMKRHPESEDELFNEFSRSVDGDEKYMNFGKLSLEDVDDVRFEDNPGSWTSQSVSVPLFSNGIVYLDAAFDVSDFSIEELESLNVYARLLTMCSTKEKDMMRVQTDIRYTSGGYAFYIESGESLDGGVKSYLLFRMRALKETAHQALDEFIRLLNDGLVIESEVENALTDISTDYKSGVIQSGHSYAISASSAPLSSSSYIGERLSGLSFWFSVEKKRKDVKAEVERIRSVKEKLLNSERLKVQTLSDKENVSFMEGEATYFISSFRKEERRKEPCVIPSSFPSLSAFLLSTPVSYGALSISTQGIEWKDTLSIRMFLSILSNDALWDLIRAKGGAYGTGCMLDNLENRLFFYTYRDPRGVASFDDFIKAVEMEKIDETKLSDARINIKSLDRKPQSPSQKALTYFRRRLFCVSDEYRRRLRRDLNLLSLSDVDSARSLLLSLMRDGCNAKSVIIDKKERGMLEKDGYAIFPLPL